MKNKEANFILESLVPPLVRNILLMVRYRCIIHPSAKILFPRNLTIGRGSRVGKCDIAAQGPIIIGENCKIGDYAILNSKKGYISIGSESAINEFCIIQGSGGVEIGQRCAIAPSVKFLKNHIIPVDKNAKYGSTTDKLTKVGRNVWIGADTVIIDGVAVGDYTIVGANSFVNKNIPSSVVAAGTPVRVIKSR